MVILAKLEQHMSGERKVEFIGKLDTCFDHRWNFNDYNKVFNVSGLSDSYFIG